MKDCLVLLLVLPDIMGLGQFILVDLFSVALLITTALFRHNAGPTIVRLSCICIQICTYLGVSCFDA